MQVAGVIASHHRGALLLHQQQRGRGGSAEDEEQASTGEVFCDALVGHDGGRFGWDLTYVASVLGSRNLETQLAARRWARRRPRRP